MLLSLLFAVSFFTSALAQANSDTMVWTRCKTAFASVPYNNTIATTFVTSTTGLSPVFLIVPTKSTVTQTPNTVTISAISTQWITATVTAPVITNLVSTTSTDRTTTTVLQFTTITQTTAVGTTTTIRTTATIPTRSGFKFISDTMQTAIPQVKRDKLWWPNRRQDDNPDDTPDDTPPPYLGLRNLTFPSAVSCTVMKGIRPTSTIRIDDGTVTLRQKPTTTTFSTSTTITTTTTIIPPNVVSTLSFTTTLTDTSTKFVVASATITQTSTVSATTTLNVYAACASQNLIGPAVPSDSSNYIVDAFHNPNLFNVANDPTAYDCCVRCINDPNCMGAGWDSSGSNTCFLMEVKKCPAVQSQFSGYYSWQPGGNGFGPLIVANGNCGFMYNGGKWE